MVAKKNFEDIYMTSDITTSLEFVRQLVECEERYQFWKHNNNNLKEIRKMAETTDISKVRVFESVAKKERTRKDGTKIEKGEVTKITEVTFKNGEVERAYCDPADTFDIQIGIIICIAKWACEGSKGLYNEIETAEKAYQKPFDDAKKAEEEKVKAEHRDEKRRKEKQKQIDRRREKRIEEQKEAFIRAIKELSNEKKGSSDTTDTYDYDTVEAMLKDILYKKKKKKSHKKKHKKEQFY